MKWKQKEVENAISLLKQNKTYIEIGQQLNRTANSVRGKLQKLGFSYIEELKENRICLNCNKLFETTKNNKQKFCSNSCSVTYNNRLRGKEKYCLNCNKKINSWNAFCSKKCVKTYSKKKFFEQIENGNTSLYEKHYKDYLIEKYGEKCMECGWNKIHPITGNVPIQLEHIDGNSENNSLDNLKLLCPNCHSLTLTFGALNKGNGREMRRIKRQQKNI